MNTKLIMVEGLPGSGKSTFAQFIALQLNRNQYDAKWYYEVELDNPLDFSYEAFLTKWEYFDFLKKFSQYKVILETEVIQKEDYYTYKYLRMSQKYRNHLPEALISYLEAKDASLLELDDYLTLRGKLWNDYFKNSLEEMTVIESSYFQSPIVELLLRNVKPNIIKKHIKSLSKVAKIANPTLIYIQEQNVEQAIKEVFKIRGDSFADYVFHLVEKSPYGETHSEKGLPLALQFFIDYSDLANAIFEKLKMNKLLLKKLDKNFPFYEDQVLKFLNIKRVMEYEVPSNVLKTYAGKYECKEVGKTFFIRFEQESLYLYLNETYKERLIPFSINAFHCQGNSLDILFLQEDDEVKNFMITGRPTAVDYGQNGFLFAKSKA